MHRSRSDQRLAGELRQRLRLIGRQRAEHLPHSHVAGLAAQALQRERDLLAQRLRHIPLRQRPAQRLHARPLFSMMLLMPLSEEVAAAFASIVRGHEGLRAAGPLIPEPEQDLCHLQYLDRHCSKPGMAWTQQAAASGRGGEVAH